MRISNVKLGLAPPRGAWLSWELGEHRFNLNVSADGSLNAQGLIWKRLAQEPKHGAPLSRSIDPNVKANAAMLQEAQAFAREHELLAAAQAKELERIAERDARNEARMAYRNAEELGPDSLYCLRIILERFGNLRPSEDWPQAQREALVEAERIIALADKGERQKFRLRLPESQHFHEQYALTKESALRSWAFCNARPGDNGTFLPEEIELEAGQ